MQSNFVSTYTIVQQTIWYKLFLLLWTNSLDFKINFGKHSAIYAVTIKEDISKYLLISCEPLYSYFPCYYVYFERMHSTEDYWRVHFINDFSTSDSVLFVTCSASNNNKREGSSILNRAQRLDTMRTIKNKRTGHRTVLRCIQRGLQ